MNREQKYTTKLQAGLGLIEETRTLLNIWKPGMKSTELYHMALESGYFPGVTARRLLNVVKECFSPRYLASGDYPAWMLKRIEDALTSEELTQLLFLFTARANLIFDDFVKQVYWSRYSGGYEEISNDDAKDFVIQANKHGKTTTFWSASTIKKVSSYLTGCCADFGLLNPGSRSSRKIVPFRIRPIVVAIIAYELHFLRLGDNTIVNHPDWSLFGLEKEDILEELKQLSFRGFFIIQSAGDIIRIGWKLNDWEELIDVITER